MIPTRDYNEVLKYPEMELLEYLDSIIWYVFYIEPKIILKIENKILKVFVFYIIFLIYYEMSHYEMKLWKVSLWNE